MTETFCGNCGHPEWQHSPFASRSCAASVDKRHVSTGGSDLSPCDCVGFKPATWFGTNAVIEGS